jgi:hypothetical protein
MPCDIESPNEMLPDEAGCAQHQNAHRLSLHLSTMTGRQHSTAPGS